MLDKQKSSRMAFYDVARVRKDFPILKNRHGLGRADGGRRLVYLDNAATTQKPQCVIDAVVRFYSVENANVHRGIHRLAQIASERYETARREIAAFLGATKNYEIIFTRGATEGINLVAHSFARSCLQTDDEILITHLEHHSNIVPWQLLCGETGAKLRVAPIDNAGELLMEAFDRLLNERTKIVAVTHVANALGTINPVREICRKAKQVGAATLVDGAQSASHTRINLDDLGADFFVCSGHKMYGPTGVGVLCARTELLERMPPYQGGSGMVETVTFEKTTFAALPRKFEAGTPNIAGAIGLGAAIDYLNSIGMDAIEMHERELLAYATEALAAVPGLKIIGDTRHKRGILSFIMDGVHPHDIAQLLDNEGVAIRSGHHCAQPLMQFYNVPATARASFGLYNTEEDIDALVAALRRVREVFA